VRAAAARFPFSAEYIRGYFSRLSYGFGPDERHGLTRFLELAQDASANAYAPYSKFHVGAAALLRDGRVVTALGRWGLGVAGSPADPIDSTPGPSASMPTSVARSRLFQKARI